MNGPTPFLAGLATSIALCAVAALCIGVSGRIELLTAGLLIVVTVNIALAARWWIRGRHSAAAGALVGTVISAGAAIVLTLMAVSAMMH